MAGIDNELKKEIFDCHYRNKGKKEQLIRINENKFVHVRNYFKY